MNVNLVWFWLEPTTNVILVFLISSNPNTAFWTVLPSSAPANSDFRGEGGGASFRSDYVCHAQLVRSKPLKKIIASIDVLSVINHQSRKNKIIFCFVNIAVLSNTFTDISVSVEEDLMKGVEADQERPFVDHIVSWINSTKICCYTTSTLLTHRFLNSPRFDARFGETNIFWALILGQIWWCYTCIKQLYFAYGSDHWYIS